MSRIQWYAHQQFYASRIHVEITDRLAKQLEKGHVNNVMYNRYAESGRVEWAQNYGRFIDPGNAEAWFGMVRPTETGLILRKIITEFKFVSVQSQSLLRPNLDSFKANEISGSYHGLPQVGSRAKPRY